MWSSAALALRVACGLWLPHADLRYGLTRPTVNEVFRNRAACYSGERTGRLVQGWELSTPSPEAALHAGLSDILQYLLTLTY